ncbi:hypothetical protein BH20ACT9_BH20ACT9_10310 [soil metagenome]
MHAAPSLIHLVADYGAGDLAFSEVTQRLLAHLPGVTVVATPVGAFDTLAAGFCVAQLALNPGPGRRVVVHNVAPRADRHGPRPGNRGERLLAGRTEAGTLVVGPDDVPVPPERVVVYVDGYGNLKTSWSHSPAASGERVRVRVGGGVGRATASDGTFEVAEGELSFAPGSSGWPQWAGGRRRFSELFLRGGSAARQFQEPGTGAMVEIEADT